MTEKLLFQHTDFSLIRVQGSLRYYAEYRFADGDTNYLVCSVMAEQIWPNSPETWHSEVIKFTLPGQFPESLLHKQDASPGIILTGNNLYFYSREQKGVLIGQTRRYFNGRYMYPLDMLSKKIIEYEHNRNMYQSNKGV